MGRGLMLAIGPRRIGAVDGTRRCEGKMLDPGMAAAFEHAEEAGEIAARIIERVRERVPDAGLGGKMQNIIRLGGFEEHRDSGFLAKVERLEVEAGLCRELRQSRVFQRDIVIVVEAIDADDFSLKSAQGHCAVEADEAGSPCDKHAGAGKRKLP